MKSRILVATVLLIVALLTGCNRDYMSERGFSLPEGDPIAGKETFSLYAV